MATHPYSPQHYNYGSLDDSYKHYQWGVTHETLPHYSPQLDTLQYLSHDRPNDEHPLTHIDYSQASSMQQNFRKLKANQLEVLKQLRRQYQVLKNTDLDAGKSNKNKIETESIQSNDSVSRSGFSQARSSSNSHRQTKSRMKSHQKEIQIAILQKKQLEVIVANSMRKIEQLLKQQIELKKTVSELKGKLQVSAAAQTENLNHSKKHNQEIQLMKNMLEQRKAECESLREKLKALNMKLQAYQKNEERERAQLKGKQDRIRALQQEIYLQKSRVTNLQLDLKKQLLDFELIENKYQNQIAMLQKRLLEPSMTINERNQEINKLKYQLELKDQRYKILASHADKEQKETNSQTKQYIKALENLIATFKDEKQQKANSLQALTLVLQKLNEAQQSGKAESILSSEVSLLRKQLDQLRNNPSKREQSHLLDRIKHLEKIIEDENVQKFYFFEDLKKLQQQLNEEKKSKQQALREVRESKATLRKVEQQAKLFSYELDTIRTHNIDLTQSQHHSKSLLLKVQQMHQKQMQIIQLKAENEEKSSHHKKQILQYEQQLKIVKRQLAQQQIKTYRVKEELELKISLTKTQYQAEISRLQDEIQREKKTHAINLNEKVNQNVELQSRFLQKNKQVEQSAQQLSNLLKQRDGILQAIRNEHEQKLKHLQERHNAEIKGLAQKLESLAVLNQKHGQALSRNAILQQEIIDTKRCLRHNRQINEGVDHLWRVKEAEYSNINQILKILNDS